MNFNRDSELNLFSYLFIVYFIIYSQQAFKSKVYFLFVFFPRFILHQVIFAKLVLLIIVSVSHFPISILLILSGSIVIFIVRLISANNSSHSSFQF